jgi:hypothetical protein
MNRDVLRGSGYLLIAVFLVVGGVRVARVAASRSASVQAELRSTEVKNQRLRDRLAELTARPEAEDHAAAPVVSAHSDPTGDRYVVRSSEEAGATAAGRHFDSPVDFFAAHPEFETLYLNNVRNELEVRYAPFFRLAQLGPDQSRRFVELLTTHAESLADVLAAARDQGLDENDTLVQPLQEQANAQLASGLLTLLGQAGYDQFQTYQHSLDWRSELNAVAGVLYASGAPLTFDQANALTAVLSEQLGQRVSDRNRLVLPPTADFDGALARARTILQPSQLPAFQAVLEQINLSVQTAKLQLPNP